MQQDGIKELTGQQEIRPGGHNWPDMYIVVDPSQTEIEDGQIYLVAMRGRGESVKKLSMPSPGMVMASPALASIHGQTTIELFGRKMPCQTIEFTDTYYRRDVTVRGRVVGFWAGTMPVMGDE